MNNSTVSFDHREERMLVPYAFKAVFSVAVSAVALLSVFGNVLAIITFLKTQNLRTSTNYYITSMAVSDLLYVATQWPLFVRSRHSVLRHTVSVFQCKLVTYSADVSYSVSILSLVLISVDRFIATVFPMNAAMVKGRIRAVLIVLTWILPIGILGPYPVVFSKVAEETDGRYICTTDGSELVVTIYSILGIVTLYCAPLLVIIILNARIMKSLRRTNPVINGNGHSSARRRKQSQRIMKCLIMISAFFFVCWTPNYLTLIIFTFLPNALERYAEEMLAIAGFYFLPFVSTAVNPVILFRFSTNYQQGLKSCLRLAVVKCRSCLVPAEAAHQENVELPELK